VLRQSRGHAAAAVRRRHHHRAAPGQRIAQQPDDHAAERVGHGHELGVSQVSADLDYFRLTREFTSSTSEEQRVRFLDVLFALADAEELIQYAVRRGLINQTEGDQVLDDVRGTSAGKSRGSRPGKGTARKPAAPKGPSVKKPAIKKPPAAKPPKAKAPKAKAPARARPAARRPVKKR